jgi:hypothetical protein
MHFVHTPYVLLIFDIDQCVLVCTDLPSTDICQCKYDQVLVRTLSRFIILVLSVNTASVHHDTSMSEYIQHLEPWQRSISSVGPSISAYFDIEIETFDIERYYMTFDIEIRY